MEARLKWLDSAPQQQSDEESANVSSIVEARGKIVLMFSYDFIQCLIVSLIRL